MLARVAGLSRERVRQIVKQPKDVAGTDTPSGGQLGGADGPAGELARLGGRSSHGGRHLDLGLADLGNQQKPQKVNILGR
jgi:hypothetical protein